MINTVTLSETKKSGGLPEPVNPPNNIRRLDPPRFRHCTADHGEDFEPRKRGSFCYNINELKALWLCGWCIYTPPVFYDKLRATLEKSGSFLCPEL